MRTKRNQKERDVFLQHQVAIAKRTINMPDTILNILGGMIKEEAKEILKNNL